MRCELGMPDWLPSLHAVSQHRQRPAGLRQLQRRQWRLPSFFLRRRSLKQWKAVETAELEARAVAWRNQQTLTSQLESQIAADQQAALLRDAELERARQMEAQAALSLREKRSLRAQQDQLREIQIAADVAELEARHQAIVRKAECDAEEEDRRSDRSGGTWLAQQVAEMSAYEDGS